MSVRFLGAAPAALLLSLNFQAVAAYPMAKSVIEVQGSKQATREQRKGFFSDEIENSLPALGRSIRIFKLAKIKDRPAALKNMERHTRRLQKSMKSFSRNYDGYIPPFSVNGTFDRQTAAALVRIGGLENMSGLFVDMMKSATSEIDMRFLRNHLTDVAPQDYVAGLRGYITQQSIAGAREGLKTCIAAAEIPKYSQEFLQKEFTKLTTEKNYTTSAMPSECLEQLDMLSDKDRVDVQSEFLQQKLNNAPHGPPWCSLHNSGRKEGLDDINDTCMQHNL